MPKKKRPGARKDVIETAYATVMAMIGEGPRPVPPEEREKYPEAVKRGKKGAKKRNANLTPEQRSEIAKRAANQRWKRDKETGT